MKLGEWVEAMKRGRVLVVDDEINSLAFVFATLAEDVELKMVDSGDAALAAFSEFSPHVVLLDVTMPGMDGLEVCRRMRSAQQKRNTQIIFVSGKGSKEERMAGYASGGNDYLVKPFHFEELSAKTMGALRNFELEDELLVARSHYERDAEKFSLALQQKERLAMLGINAAQVVHNLKNPLAIMKTAIQVASKDNNEVVLELINKSVERMTGIVSDLLRNNDSNSSLTNTSGADLNAAVQNTLTFFRIDPFFLYEVKVHEELRETPRVRAGHSPLIQIIDNLLKNSIDALRENVGTREIHITTGVQNDFAFLKIVDNGKGIPLHLQERIFEPFFSTKLNCGNGTGLGLCFVKKTVESFGGQVFVSSQEGLGTCVLICLPTVME